MYVCMYVCIHIYIYITICNMYIYAYSCKLMLFAVALVNMIIIRYYHNQLLDMILLSIYQSVTNLSYLISNTIQSQFTLLIELFDSKQPFYLKHGYSKVVSTSIASDSSGSSSNDAQLKFLKSLGTGARFDYMCVYMYIYMNLYICVCICI
jgi:hypothetical protein